MTRRIFRAILAVALTVLTVALVLSVGALYSHFTRVQYSQLREETALAAHAVTRQGRGYLEGLGDSLSSRITWIDGDGTVLYDSRSDSLTMENHLQREEIRQAMETGYGQSARYSGTLLRRYLYCAQRLPDGTILRMSIQQSSVLDLMLELAGFLTAVMAVAAVLALTLAGRLSRGIVQPLNTLDLDDPMSNRGYEEIRPLLRRLELQQVQLRAQETQLRQKQKEFHAVTRSLEEGLVLLGSTGTILSINPAAARLLEVTQNCLGADFSVANQNGDIGTLVAAAFGGRKAEKAVALSAGTYLATASPVKSGGEVSGVVVLLFDITGKQEAERLRREFTANVSHELKTPLHAISGYAELMQSGLVPQADMGAFSKKIYGQAQRLIELVEDTLRLSRLDEGAADLQWVEMDLLEAAGGAAAQLQAPAELAGVTLSLEGDSVPLRGIPQLVSAIAFNLTDNAIKYNRPGGRVTLRVEAAETGGILRVSDTGIGIPEAHWERIFERFYRVDKSHSKEVGGTGLGLSIVKHAAQILKARVELNSTPGIGTTVTVHFPKNP